MTEPETYSELLGVVIRLELSRRVFNKEIPELGHLQTFSAQEVTPAKLETLNVRPFVVCTGGFKLNVNEITAQERAMEKYGYGVDEKKRGEKTAADTRYCPVCGAESVGNPPVCPEHGAAPYERDVDAEKK